MKHHEPTPFEVYLAELEGELAGLPAARRDAIRRELLAHLADAAEEQGRSADDPAFQRELIAQIDRDRGLAGGFRRLANPYARWCGLAGMIGAGQFAFQPLHTIGQLLAGRRYFFLPLPGGATLMPLCLILLACLMLGLYGRYHAAIGAGGRVALWLSGAALAAVALGFGFSPYATAFDGAVILAIVLTGALPLIGFALWRRRALPRRNRAALLLGCTPQAFLMLHLVAPGDPASRALIGAAAYGFLAANWFLLGCALWLDGGPGLRSPAAA